MRTDFFDVDPRTIVVKRKTRQRQENIDDVADLAASIAQRGLLHPIVVREEGDELVLMAGERRLKAVLSLELPTIVVRNFGTLPETDAEVIELEENLKRADLTWRDQVTSIGRLHDLYKKQTEGWRIEQTAQAISLHQTQLRKILHVYEALPTGRVDKAEGIEQAYNTLQRFTERKAESIVAGILMTGAEIFADEPKAAQQPPTIPQAPSASPQAPVSAPTAAPEGPTAPPQGQSVTIGSLTAAPEPQPSVPTPTSTPTPTVLPSEPIVNANFLEWAATYNGPKFTLIHCDFPYGNYKGNDSKGSMSVLETRDFYDNTEDVYWNLLTGLIVNLDRIMSYSAHMVFWFNMNFYTETVRRLRSAGLTVHDHPLVWHKTGGPGGLGVAPGTEATHPRRTYDTALLAVRGNRPLVRTLCNSYAAPTAGNKIHPSQKPEPMLRYFLQMVVDETTTVFDPTCGSAAALRAAEDLGAKAILGLELDPNHAAEALKRTKQARVLRAAGQKVREE